MSDREGLRNTRRLYGAVTFERDRVLEQADVLPSFQNQTSPLKIGYLVLIVGFIGISYLATSSVNPVRPTGDIAVDLENKFSHSSAFSHSNATNSTHDSRKPQLNIILILADDLDLVLDGMMTATNILSEIRDKGTSLEYFFANNPECCPSRATLLTGRYTHNQRSPIINNTVYGNCGSMKWAMSDGQHTIGRKMEALGYTTAFVGKFLNGYGSGYGKDRGTPVWDGNDEGMPLEMVPPGWGEWIVRKGSSNYYWNYSLSVNGVAEDIYVSTAVPAPNSKDAQKYSQTVFNNYTLSWMEAKLAAQNLTNGPNFTGIYNMTPFFLLASPSAPHATFDADPDDYFRDYTDYKAPRTPNFYKRPNNTLGDWVTTAMYGGEDKWAEDYTDWVFQRRLTTMVALDRYVQNMMKLVEKYDQMNNTVWIFTSDNGHHLGQFGYSYEKAKPWETDIRLPFYIRGPSFAAGKVIKGAQGFGAMVDILPTLYELGGGDNNHLESTGDIDGRSLVDLLRGNGGYGLSTDTLIRMDISSQKKHSGCHTNGNGYSIPSTVSAVSVDWYYTPPWPKRTFSYNRTFCFGINAWNTTYYCLRTIRLGNTSNDTMYCEYPDSTESLVTGLPRNELFDLTTDPWQMTNLVRMVDRALLYNYSDRLAYKMSCRGSGNCTSPAGSAGIYSYNYTQSDSDDSSLDSSVMIESSRTQFTPSMDYWLLDDERTRGI